MTAVGLLNRRAQRPAACALFSNSNRHEQDEAWLGDALRSGDPLLTPTPRLVNSTNATEFVLAAVAAGAVHGRVLTDNKAELHALATALTLGGIHSSVVVDCGGGANSSNPLCHAELEGQLPTKHDCRGQWADAKVATSWAIDHIMNASSNDDTMVYSDPATLAAGYEVDLIVSRRLFAIWPEAPGDTKNALSSDGICINGSASHELFVRATQSTHWRGAKLLSVMGYNTRALWWSEVTSMCTPKHDVLSLVADYVTSFSFHEQLSAFGTMNHAALPAVQPPLYNSSKTYVAIVRSDGDNMQIVTGPNREKMQTRLELCRWATDHNRSIACPPLSWTLSNRLIEYAPDVLRWYYAAAATTGHDSSLMGPSGFGYNFPSAISPPSKQANFAHATAAAAAELGWEAYVHWDRIGPTTPGPAGPADQPNASSDTATLEAYIQRLNQTAIKGVFMRFPESMALPDQIGSVMVIKAHQALDQPPPDIAASLNAEWMRGSTTFLYEIWDTDIEQSWASEMAEHVELVGHRELIELQRQRLGASGH